MCMVDNDEHNDSEWNASRWIPFRITRNRRFLFGTFIAVILVNVFVLRSHILIFKLLGGQRRYRAWIPGTEMIIADEDENNISEDQIWKVHDRESCQFSKKKVKTDIDTYQVWRDNMIFDQRKGKPEGTDEYQTDDKTLRIFIVPFTHVDPGWLETYEQYTRQTDSILQQMTEFLPTHPEMTFNWMEISFFQRWWIKQNVTVRSTVQKLLKDGRFDFASGSWTMTDEASPYYWATIDNIIHGQQFLHRELGIRPSLEWTCDPFGYGPTFEDSEDSDGTLANLLPGSHYDIINTCGPDGSECCKMDFMRLIRWSCPGPRPVVTNELNVEEKARNILKQYRSMAKWYHFNTILVVHGDDFRYQEAQEWQLHYDNILPIIKEINGNKAYGAHIKFGTFTEFFDALEQRATKFSERSRKDAFSSLSGDFFPYSDMGGTYWTGYFTSRPFWKRLDRLLQAEIRAADVISAFATAQNALTRVEVENVEEKLRQARETLALFQHHDAITGTSKLAVVQDYGKKLFLALTRATSVVELSAASLLGLRGKRARSLERVIKANAYDKLEDIHSAFFGDQESGGDRHKVSLIIFNPLPHVTPNHLVRVRTNSPNVAVVRMPEDGRGGKEAVLQAQINPYWHPNESNNGNLDKNSFEVRQYYLFLLFIFKVLKVV